HRIARRTHAAVERADERLNMRVERLAQVVPATIVREAQQLAQTESQIMATATSAVQRSSDRLDIRAARVAALDPAVQLARGWSITRRADGKLIRSTAKVSEGDVLTTSLIDGTITSTATQTSSTPLPNDNDSPTPKD
ncbi:MAG: hypothetical protein DRJ50_05815, partial [Actinobacteria bacterium]